MRTGCGGCRGDDADGTAAVLPKIVVEGEVTDDEGDEPPHLTEDEEEGGDTYTSLFQHLPKVVEDGAKAKRFIHLSYWPENQGIIMRFTNTDLANEKGEGAAKALGGGGSGASIFMVDPRKSV